MYIHVKSQCTVLFQQAFSTWKISTGYSNIHLWSQKDFSVPAQTSITNSHQMAMRVRSRIGSDLMPSHNYFQHFIPCTLPMHTVMGIWAYGSLLFEKGIGTEVLPLHDYMIAPNLAAAAQYVVSLLVHTLVTTFLIGFWPLQHHLTFKYVGYKKVSYYCQGT